jgi:hypothetical protein
MTDTEQHIRRLAYGIGYRAARRYSEFRRRDPDLRNEPARSTLIRDALLAVIVRRLGALDAKDLRAIREGVNDAIEGRMPKW